MKHKKRKKLYLLPALSVLVVAICLMLGGWYIRSYMEQQTVQERTSQLEEVISLVRVNLNSGLRSHWNLVSGIDAAVEGKHYEDDNALVEVIQDLEKIFCTDLYDSRIMLLNTQGVAYISDGAVGIWDDISYLADGESRKTFISDTSNMHGTFFAFSQKMERPITVGSNHEKFTHLVLLKNIESLREYYTIESYSGQIATYILNENGTLVFSMRMALWHTMMQKRLIFWVREMFSKHWKMWSISGDAALIRSKGSWSRKGFVRQTFASIGRSTIIVWHLWNNII